MPLANHVYAQITVRMAHVMARLTQQWTRQAIGRELSISPSSVRDEVERAERVTGCESQRELVAWWLQHRVPWALWLLSWIAIEPRDLAGRDLDGTA